MSDMDTSHTQQATVSPEAQKPPSKVKNLAYVLATIGIIPVFICALGIATHVNLSMLLLKILLAYSALLVSFMCGTHWGIAVCQDYKFPKLSRTLIVEGIILAFCALGILFIHAAWMQILAFAGALALIWLIDLLISMKRMIPFWFLGLHTLVTVLVVGLLILTRFSIH